MADGPKTTGDLCSNVAGLDRCTVMKYLDVLVNAGLVVVERRGRSRYNYLNPAPLHAVVERWLTGHTARDFARNDGFWCCHSDRSNAKWRNLL